MSDQTAAQNYMTSKADSMVNSIVQLHNAGATHFVLGDLNGIADNGLGVLYNNRLWRDLNAAGIQFIVADDTALVRDMAVNPANYGITNPARPPAGPFTSANPYSTSNGGSVVNPNPSALPNSWSLFGIQDVSANPANTYRWADDQHLAEAGQRAEANYAFNAIQHAVPVVSETLNATVIVFADQFGTPAKGSRRINGNVYRPGKRLGRTFLVRRLLLT
jgi:hypothetical protein